MFIRDRRPEQHKDSVNDLCLTSNDASMRNDAERTRSLKHDSLDERDECRIECTFGNCIPQSAPRRGGKGPHRCQAVGSAAVVGWNRMVRANSIFSSPNRRKISRLMACWVSM